MKYKIEFNPSRIFEVGYFIFLIAIATLAIINLTSRIPNKTPVKILSVVSGSMTPTIPIGSAIFVQKQPEYFNGDIVTYRLENNYVTHRIFYSGKYYLTKGDANKEVDQFEVQKDQIIGKVTFSTPYLGYIQESTKSLWGLIGFVYIPTLVVLLAESKLIISEIKKVQVRKVPLQSAFTILTGIFVISGVSLAYYSTTAFAFSANLTAVFPSPSASPSSTPSTSPTPSPTPTLTPSASATPTVAPTATPTIAPTATPTASPSLTPTPSGTPVPTVLPSACPTTGAVNCGNGAGSNNTVIIENNSTTIINQQNSSNSSTVITVNSQTGNNSGNGNSSNTQISTGNSNISVYTGNIVNSNSFKQ